MLAAVHAWAHTPGRCTPKLSLGFSYFDPVLPNTSIQLHAFSQTRHKFSFISLVLLNFLHYNGMPGPALQQPNLMLVFRDVYRQRICSPQLGAIYSYRNQIPCKP